MGISRDSQHKRRLTGGKKPHHHKKRKHEMGRQMAMTKIGAKRIHPVRCRGGNMKFRGIRLDTGNFSWGSEVCTRKTRILDVVYNASNNELVRTKTLVKSAVVQIDATCGRPPPPSPCPARPAALPPRAVAPRRGLVGGLAKGLPAGRAVGGGACGSRTDGCREGQMGWGPASPQSGQFAPLLARGSHKGRGKGGGTKLGGSLGAQRRRDAGGDRGRPLAGGLLPAHV